MQLQNNSSPPPYFNRRDQNRMLLMVGTLCLVLVMIKLASNPNMWSWFSQKDKSQTTTKQSTESDPSKHLKRSYQDESNFGGFTSDSKTVPPEKLASASHTHTEPETPSEANSENTSTEKTTSHDGKVQTESSDSSTSSSTTITETVLSDRLQALIQPGTQTRIREEQLEPIIDARPDRKAEQKIYTDLLQLSLHLEWENQSPEILKDVSMVALEESPDYFRGRLVRLEGKVNLVYELPLPPNEFGMKMAYECWIQPSDFKKKPYRVVCLKKPEQVEVGRPLTDPKPVVVTGYFFKLYGYMRQDNVSQVAPMFLAKELTLKPIVPSRVEEQQKELTLYLLLGFIALGLLVIFLVWRYQAGDRKFEQAHRERLSTTTSEAVESLDGIETRTNEEFLGTLSQDVSVEE